MKPATKIFLAFLIVIISTFCVAMFLSRSNNVVLVIYNPVTNSTTQQKVENGKKLGEVFDAPLLDGYTFVSYYNSSDFAKEISTDLAITNNTTVVLGYSKNITDLDQCSNNVVGVNFSGELSTLKLEELLSKNYKYLNLEQAELKGEFLQYNTSLKTLVLPSGNIEGINNYSELQSVKIIQDCQIVNSFNNCPMLSSVNVSSCASITNSFNNCEQLKEFKIPSNMQDLNNSFVNTYLTDITNSSNYFMLENGVLYSLKNSEVVAKKAVSTLVDVLINNGATQIDDYAFYNHPNIQTLTINAKVASIGQASFYGSNIKELQILQNNVLTIKKDAFRNCINLQNADFGKGVETIGEFAFYGSAISQLNFENSVLSKVQSYAFAQCKNLTEVSFLEKQITLEKGVFSGCENLVKISHLNTEVVPEKAFENCKKLENLINFTNVQSVENYAFSNCFSLENITEISTAKTIGIGGFENCISLIEAKFLNLENISENLFFNCKELTTFVSAQSIIQLNVSAFDGCENLASLSLVGDKFVIEDGVIYNTNRTQLLYYLPTKTAESFTLDSTIEMVNNKYLSANKFLKEINSDSSHFETEDGILFSADKQILLSYPSGKTQSSYVIPTFVNTLSTYSFVKSPNLTKLTIPESVITIKNGFLWQNSALVTLVTSFIGESINNIPSSFLGWFFGANNIHENSQYIPDNLKEVVVNNQTVFGEKCFYDCNNLLTIKLEKCSEVTQSMFYNCYSLQTLTLNTPIEKIDEYALFNCKNLININTVYNSQLSALNIKSTALLNTPKSVKVNVYCNEQISAAQFANFKICFKEKQYDWTWKTVIIK